MTQDFSTKTFTMMIVILLSITVVMNSIMIYSMNISLNNQGEMLVNQDEVLRDQDKILMATQTEQSDAIEQILEFINRTDITLDQLIN